MGFTIFTTEVEKEQMLDMQNWGRHSLHKACASSGRGHRSPQALQTSLTVTQSLRRKAVDTHMQTARNASPDTDSHLKTKDSKSRLTNLRRCTVRRSFCLKE